MSLLNIISDTIKPFDILALLLTAISLYIARFYYQHFTRINPLPGPIPIPFIGGFFIFKKDFETWFFALHKKYGDIFEVTFAGMRQIVLCRAEYVDKMLVPSMNNYMIRFPSQAFVEAFDSDRKGLAMNNDLQTWKFNRQFFSQAIMTPSFSIAANKWTNEMFEEMEKYWMDLKKPDDSEDAVIIDMAAWMRRFTNDLISVLTTGKRTYTISFHYHKLKNVKLSEEMIESEKFVTSLNDFVSGSGILVLVPKYLRFLPIIRGKVKKTVENRDYLYGKLVGIIRERRKEIEEAINENKNTELRHDMLTSFITANTPYDINSSRHVDPELSRPMTDDEIRADMLDIFLGGTDTGDETRQITLEDIEKLKYCEAIIKETSRIRPTVNMIGRFGSLPDEIAGYKWPESTQFQMYIHAINNNPSHWEEPDKFNPDRFIDNQVTENQRKNSFLMFGGGLRICPGKKIAMIEMKALLALIYRKFDVDSDTSTIFSQSNDDDLFYDKHYNEETFMNFDDDEESGNNIPQTSPLLSMDKLASHHIKQAEDALSRLKSEVDQPGWKKLLTHRHGVVVYGKSDDKLPIFMGEHIIKGFAPQSVFAVIGTRKLWDDWYEEGNLVENLNENTSLTYIVIQALAGSKARDLSLVEKIECTLEGKIYFVSTSVNTPKIPHISNRIRAHIHLNGWILEPLSYNPPATKINYILQANVKGWVPGVIAKKYLTRRPLIIDTIDTYLQKNGPPTMFLQATNTNTFNDHSTASLKHIKKSNQNGDRHNIGSLRAKIHSKLSSSLSERSPRIITSINRATHRHSETLRAAMDNFKSQARSLDGWNFYSNDKGVKIYSKDVGGKSIPMIRGESRISGGFTVEDILSIINSVEMRKIWDERFEDSVVLEKLNHFDSLVKSVIKGSFSISGRDLSLASTIEYDFETGIVRYVSTSVIDPLIPETKKYVRAQLDFAGFEFASKFDDEGFTKYVDIKYIADIDAKIDTVPSIILRQVSIQTPIILNRIDELLQKSGFPPYVRESTSQTSMKSCVVNTKTFECDIEVVDVFGGAVTELKTSRKMYPNGYELTIKPENVKVELLPSKFELVRIMFPTGNDYTNMLKIKIKRNTSKGVDFIYNDFIRMPSISTSPPSIPLPPLPTSAIVSNKTSTSTLAGLLKTQSKSNNDNNQMFRRLTNVTTTIDEEGKSFQRISINNLNDHFASSIESSRFNVKQAGLMFASMLLMYYAGKLGISM
nr:9936_t:CDS:10 [Entrophospora candida]